MGQPQIDAVVAGTKGFAVALFAPVAARLGTRPRVAGDPGQVLGLCSGPSALAIIEFKGEGSLAAIQALVRDGRGMRVIAGVPAAHAQAEATLQALGVETARWDGRVDAVVAAVERAVAVPVASSPEPIPAPPPAAAAAPEAPPQRPASPAAPVSAPARLAPVAAPPPPLVQRAPAAAPAASAPRAASTAAASLPAPKAAAPAAPRLAPAGTAPAPALAPAARAPTAPPAPALPRAAPPAAAPRLATAAAPRPAPAAAPIAPRPALAVAAPPVAPRRTAAAPAADGAVTPELSAATVAAPPAVPAAARFFMDLEPAGVGGDDLGPAQPPAAPDLHAPRVYVPPPAVPQVAWPAGGSTALEAEAALRGARRGDADLTRPLHALASQVLESLSGLEQRVMAGEPQPVDGEPIRRAAVMRLRVAEALATSPATGAPVDAAALSAMLGEIDAQLAAVAALLPSAPPELAPELESIRNALVSEAIDFSEAAQRVATQASVAEATKPLASARAAQARVLSVEKESEADRQDRRRNVVLGVVLGLTLAAGLAFHGYRYWQRAQVVPPPPPFEVPAGFQLPATPARGPVVLRRTKGPVDQAALQRFREQQEAAGKQVFEMESGSVVVVPQGVPPPAGVRK